MNFWVETKIVGSQLVRSVSFATVDEARLEACRMLAKDSRNVASIVSENGVVIGGHEIAQWCAKQHKSEAAN
jgi:hypothetical protein